MASNKLSKPLEAELTRLYKAWGPQQAEEQAFAMWVAMKQSWLADLRKFARMVEEEKKTQIMQDLDGLERATRAKRPSVHTHRALISGRWQGCQRPIFNHPSDSILGPTPPDGGVSCR